MTARTGEVGRSVRQVRTATAAGSWAWRTQPAPRAATPTARVHGAGHQRDCWRPAAAAEAAFLASPDAESRASGHGAGEDERASRTLLTAQSSGCDRSRLHHRLGPCILGQPRLELICRPFCFFQAQREAGPAPQAGRPLRRQAAGSSVAAVVAGWARALVLRGPAVGGALADPRVGARPPVRAGEWRAGVGDAAGDLVARHPAGW